MAMGAAGEVAKAFNTPLNLGLKGIEVLGSILTGAQVAQTEAARINAQVASEREGREHELNKLTLETARKYASDAQESLKSMSSDFQKTMREKEEKAIVKERLLQDQITQMRKEQLEKEKEMSKASVEERRALAEEYKNERQKKEEEIKLAREESAKERKDLQKLHQETIKESNSTIKQLNEKIQETAVHLGEVIQEQADRHRMEMRELNEQRFQDGRRHADQVERMRLEQRHLYAGVATMGIEMARNAAASRECGETLEHGNTLRLSFRELKDAHAKATEYAMLAITDSTYAEARGKFDYLEKKIEHFGGMHDNLMRNLCRSNSLGREVLEEQQKFLALVESALCSYQLIVTKFLARLKSKEPFIGEDDMENLNVAQLELVTRMNDVPFIRFRDEMQDIQDATARALNGVPPFRAIEGTSTENPNGN